MPGQVQTYTIKADSSQAEQANARVNAGIRDVGSSAQASNKQAAQSYEAYARSLTASNRMAEASTQSHSRALAALGVAGVGAYAAMGSEAAKYSSHATRAAASTDGLIEKLGTLAKVARIAISPTLGTLAGIGAIYGAEQILQYSYQRGGQINAQAFTAAQSKSSLERVETIQAIAQARGSNPNVLADAAVNLRDRLKTDTGAEAFAGLGLRKSSSDIENIKQIASAFSAITDPVTKAKIAIDLFGSSAESILPELNQSFTDSASNIEKWGVSIGSNRAADVTQFRQNVDELKRSLFSLGDFLTVAEAKVGNFFAGIGARAGNFIFNGASVLFGSNSALQASQTNLISGTARGKNNALGISGTAANVFNTDDFNSSVNKAIADNLDLRLANAEARNRESAHALSVGYTINSEKNTLEKLTPSQRAGFGEEFLSAQRQIVDLKAQKKATEDAKQAATDAQASALEATRHNAELTRTLRSLARKTEDRGPYGEVFNDIQRARTFIDRSGIAQTQDLNPQQQIDAATSYHNTVAQLQKKSSAEAVKLYEQEFLERLRLEDQIFQKRKQVEEEINGLSRSTLEKQFSAERDDANSAHASALNALRLSDPNQAQNIAAQLALSTRFSAQSARLDIDQIDRQRRASLVDHNFSGQELERLTVGSGGARGAFGIPINPFGGATASLPTFDDESAQRYRLRAALSTSSFEDAAAVQRRVNAELLTAQQQAAIDSAQLVKDANLRSFTSLKDQVSGVLDSIESKSRNVFQAIGDTLKHSILGAINDIVSSQVAAGLFGIFNPGTSVKGFEAESGLKRPGIAGALQRFGLGAGPSFSGVPGFSLPSILGAPGGTVSAFSGTDLTAPLNPFGGASALLPTFGDSTQASGGGGGRFGLSGGMMAQLAAVSGGFAVAGSDAFAQTAQLTYGGPGGTPGFAGPVGGFSVPQPSDIPLYGGGPAGESAGAGAAHGIKGLLGGKGFDLAALKNLYFNSGSISLGSGIATTAAGIKAALGGGIIGSLAGGAAGFIASPAAGTLGATLALGGLTAKRQTVLTSAQTVGGSALAGASIGANTSLGIVKGGLTGAGVGLVLDGVRRGGKLGIVEDTAGGAIVGFENGGPIGAVVGAAVGAAIGTVRLFIKGARQQIQELVKSLYKLTISNSVADQIQEIAKQNYGGSFSIAVRSPQVLDLLNLYAQATGQPFQIKNKPYAAYLTETAGGLKQAPSYINGSPISYASQAGVGVLNNQPTTVLSDFSVSQSTIRNHGNATDYSLVAPPVQQINVTLDGQSSASFLQGQTVQAIQNNPREISRSGASGQQQSVDRNRAAARLLNPTLLYS